MPIIQENTPGAQPALDPKAVIKSSPFTQALTKYVRSPKYPVICQAAADGTIYISDGRFIAALTAQEYDVLIRPAVNIDPGRWQKTKKDLTAADDPKDLQLIIRKALEAADQELTKVPIVFKSKTPSRDLAAYWSKIGKFDTLLDMIYVNMITDNLAVKSAGSDKPVLFLDQFMHPVMYVLPVVSQDSRMHNAVHSYFDLNLSSQSPSQPAAEPVNQEHPAAPKLDKNQFRPLADAMRPKKLDDIIGQDHITGQGTLLRSMIEHNNLMSVILYGPPGTGKTTIAETIANSVNAEFLRINATTSGKKQIENACTRAQQLLLSGKRTVLFIDEIHRFNKAQQDFLLPFVENGTVILIGATTENPYFEVNPALNSRAAILELRPIDQNGMLTLLYRAMFDQENGIASRNQTLNANAAVLITDTCGGDARFALNMLDLASRISEASSGPGQEITEEHARQAAQRPNLRYDKDGDLHYDIVSAFIKSMRGSDPDAVLYYLARMIESGEDPKFIARRIVIAASEDVGSADPTALQIAVSAFLATERVGMPEAAIILSHAALHVALAPKSNTAYKGIQAAMEYVKQHPLAQVPPPLQDAHYKSAGKLGRGVGYDYPHDHVNHFCNQQYLPMDVPPGLFYTSSGMGYEQAQAQFQSAIGHVIQQEDLCTKKP